MEGQLEAWCIKLTHPGRIYRTVSSTRQMKDKIRKLKERGRQDSGRPSPLSNAQYLVRNDGALTCHRKICGEALGGGDLRKDVTPIAE